MSVPVQQAVAATPGRSLLLQPQSVTLHAFALPLSRCPAFFKVERDIATYSSVGSAVFGASLLRYLTVFDAAIVLLLGIDRRGRSLRSREDHEQAVQLAISELIGELLHQGPDQDATELHEEAEALEMADH